MKPQRFSSRTRDLLSSQPGCNGKGDKSRVSDDKAYRERYDEINWNRDGLPPAAQPAATDNFPEGKVDGGVGVIEGSQCFCDGDPCRCEGELGYLQPTPGVLSAVPKEKHCEGSECAGSPRHVRIDNPQPGF